MRRLIPEPVADVDPMEIYPTLARPRPVQPDRPWLMVNMIASADGAIEVAGTSEALGNPADQKVFSAVRACADWIVVAAGTVRAERYGLPRPAAPARAARAAQGRLSPPRLAVVSGSLDLELDLPMFADQRADEPLPVILTGCDASPEAVERLGSVAEVVKLKSPRPQPEEILAELGRRGAEVVLCEGGASFNAQFAAARLIDELCLSIAPLLVGGTASRILQAKGKSSGSAGAASSAPADLTINMTIDHLLEASDTLFIRYLSKSARSSTSR